VQKRILIVEDEDAIRWLLEAVLSAAGHDVTAVARGKEALRQLQAQPHDLILSDYKMPDMDGIAFYKQACALSSGLWARFILVTGAVLSPEVLAFVGEHPVTALPKPFVPADVLQAVAEGLSTKRPMIPPS
jgi:CheY-like chemotaxis protein